MKANIRDLEMELWLRKRERGEIKWTTKDGWEVSINQMTDSHLENAINHLVMQQDIENRTFEKLAAFD